MLNEELLDEKDKKIAKLEILIRRYKEYDRKRMVYVRNLEKKYNDLLQQFEEMCDDPSSKRLMELQKGFDTLNKKLMISKYPEYIDEYNEDELNAAYKFVNMKKQVSEQQEKIKKLNRTVSSLIYELNMKR